ncbi:hypothetical protein BDF20DRAFT_276520 [Mycotypha africana]|uniref:uncharacterized protein n=1 Tax=Mycotypha africana TaxID=64632 RepID=UPI002301DF93|nr:uncharacterized protein BDF20DRAFT_276520 [Mycotypha africana]KAI8987597.1 hypothetical protein BDF20DRAFT_276520 [Mycotypha africana]
MHQQLLKKIDNMVEFKLKQYFDQLRAELFQLHTDALRKVWEDQKREFSDFATQFLENLKTTAKTECDREDVISPLHISSDSSLSTPVGSISTDTDGETETLSKEKSFPLDGIVNTEVANIQSTSSVFDSRLDCSWADIMQLEDAKQKRIKEKKRRYTETRLNHTEICQRSTKRYEDWAMSQSGSVNSLQNNNREKVEKQQLSGRPKNRTRRALSKQQMVTGGLDSSIRSSSDINSTVSNITTGSKQLRHYTQCRKTTTHKKEPSSLISSSDICSTEDGYLTFTTLINGHFATYTVKIPRQNQELHQL